MSCVKPDHFSAEWKIQQFQEVRNFPCLSSANEGALLENTMSKIPAEKNCRMLYLYLTTGHTTLFTTLGWAFLLSVGVIADAVSLGNTH